MSLIVTASLGAYAFEITIPKSWVLLETGKGCFSEGHLFHLSWTMLSAGPWGPE